MNRLKITLDTIKKELEESIYKAQTSGDIELLRTNLLGRQGSIGMLTQELKECSLEQKRDLGPLIQAFRAEAEKKLNDAMAAFLQKSYDQTVAKQRFFDVTLVKSTHFRPGSLHLMTLVQEEMEDIFIHRGFSIVQGPELETDFYNFGALNIDASHPARDAHDTFWLADRTKLLRTHTSNAQIHSMLTKEPPLAIASTGRVFRNEATDASHDFQFMQCEALLIDRSVSIAHLLYLIRHMLRSFFQHNSLEIRVRPGYFPFVEPGLEVDASCPFCKHGCSVCKKTCWIELGGAGLVHPNVLKSCNIDEKKFNGCALGFGISRLALLKYAINDVRLLHSPRVEFLSQFNRIIL